MKDSVWSRLNQQGTYTYNSRKREKEDDSAASADERLSDFEATRYTRGRRQTRRSSSVRRNTISSSSSTPRSLSRSASVTRNGEFWERLHQQSTVNNRITKKMDYRNKQRTRRLSRSSSMSSLSSSRERRTRNSSVKAEKRSTLKKQPIVKKRKKGYLQRLRIKALEDKKINDANEEDEVETEPAQLNSSLLSTHEFTVESFARRKRPHSEEKLEASDEHDNLGSTIKSDQAYLGQQPGLMLQDRQHLSTTFISEPETATTSLATRVSSKKKRPCGNTDERPPSVSLMPYTGKHLSYGEVKTQVSELQKQLSSVTTRLKHASLAIKAKDYDSGNLVLGQLEAGRNAAFYQGHANSHDNGDQKFGVSNRDDEVMKIVLDFIDEVSLMVSQEKNQLAPAALEPTSQAIRIAEDFICVKKYGSLKSRFLQRLIVNGTVRDKRLLGYVSVSIADLWHRCAGSRPTTLAKTFLTQIPRHLVDACEPRIELETGSFANFCSEDAAYVPF
mmetsp:Transcript_19963/g.31720  ORF Transcript_19963/g.31720 Transcript_19963/m.31720 type:complete len:503 (+) Transcript_19963:155-1663(+)